MSKKGVVGWVIVFASLFLWVMVVAVWYRPEPILNLDDSTNIVIALWWTIVAGMCIFVGIRMEKKRVTA